MARHAFRREGEYWSLTYAGVTRRLRDTKGLQYLAFLLAHPGIEVSSSDLFVTRAPHPSPGDRSPNGGGDARELERARVAVTKSIKTALEHIRANLPELANHLDATIHRGYACVYRPDPRVPIRWET